MVMLQPFFLPRILVQCTQYGLGENHVCRMQLPYFRESQAVTYILKCASCSNYFYFVPKKHLVKKFSCCDMQLPDSELEFLRLRFMTFFLSSLVPRNSHGKQSYRYQIKEANFPAVSGRSDRQ